MSDRPVIPSGNGFPVLEGFTKQIYGRRGTYEHNLKRYFSSQEWTEKCRCAANIEDIPLLSEEQIHQQLRWEEAMQDKARYIQHYAAARGGRMREDDYLAIAADMGLAPSPCPWEQTLFPHTVDLWVCSKREERKIRRTVEKKWRRIAMMGNIMMDALRDKQVISCRQPGTDRLRMMLSQGYARSYYRGENAYYGQSRPSLFRRIPEDPEEAKIHRLLGFVRMYEFALWLETLDCVRNWPHGDLFHGAIAQHYGIPTNGLDITSDLCVALFFACCTFENGAWRPLREEEFKKADSRPHIAALGGDARFGILFSAPTDTSFMSKELDDPALHLSCPTPVGYQPFMRCSHQSAYIIEAGEPYDLYQDATFSKYRFSLSEELCQWIYREMDGGLAIYPNEGLKDHLAVVEKISRLEHYSRAALDAALQTYVPDITADDAIAALAQRGHTCVEKAVWCSEKECAAINAAYSAPAETECYIRPQITI